MGVCMDLALDGRCCNCRGKITDEAAPLLSDEITKVQTRNGYHYLCSDCLAKQKEKYENGEIDILEIED